MTNKHHTQKQVLSVCTFVLGLAILAYSWHSYSTEKNGLFSQSRMMSECGSSCHGAAGPEPTQIERQAERLKERLERSGKNAPSVAAVVAAIEARDELLTRQVTVKVTDGTGSGSHAAEWSFQLSSYPELLSLRSNWADVRYVVDEEALSRLLASDAIPGMSHVVDARVSAIKSDGYVLRGDAQAVARDGFAYKDADVAGEIIAALADNRPTIELSVPYRQGKMILATGSGEVVLSLLATGKSDYSDSPENRVSNVKKAFNERVNNVVVAPGKEFSFVATLGGPVTLDKGWKEALGLFGGGTAMTPGGGICQAATTVFRGALLAGLPITEKRNHSVFVDHYVPYGVGLDATIFPGVHDLSFLNDTETYIVIQSYLDETKEEGYVNMYGVDDGRTVDMQGPFFASTRPRAKEVRPLAPEEIGWVRHVTYADGNTKTVPLIARYHTGFMRSVVTTYSGTPGMELLHTAAPQPQM